MTVHELVEELRKHRPDDTVTIDGNSLVVATGVVEVNDPRALPISDSGIEAIFSYPAQ
jgi:hypothetical protein